MKNFIFGIFILLSLNSLAQSSSNLNQSIETKNSKIEIEKLSKRIDSLNNTINEMKPERNYFQTALNSQTVIFSIIITLFIFAVGFFSFSKFDAKVKNSEENNLRQLTVNKELIDKTVADLKKSVESSIREHDKKLEEVHNKLSKQQRQIDLALGNLNVTIAHTTTNNIIKLKFSISAAFYLSKQVRHFAAVLVNLNDAKDILDIVKSKPELIKNLKDDENNIIKDLKNLIQIEDPKIQSISIGLLNDIINIVGG